MNKVHTIIVPNYVTTDLSKFRDFECRALVDLITAYTENPPAWLGSDVKGMLNIESGYVFLADEDCTVAMLNDEGKLDAFLNTPFDGHRGFVPYLFETLDPEDLADEDMDYIRSWAGILGYSIPTNWADVIESRWS